MVAPDQPATEARVLWDVVEEHFEEAEFLLHQWTTQRISPLYTLDELAAGPEERLAAHADGLAVGGDSVAERLLWPLVEAPGDDPLRVRAAAYVLAGLPDPRWLDAIVHRIGVTDDPEFANALTEALIASPRPDVASKVATAFNQTPAALGRAAWLRVVAARGGVVGTPIAGALDDSDADVRAAALRAVVFADRDLARWAAEARLADPEPIVRWAAAHCGAVVGSASAWSRVLDTTRGPSEALRDALTLVAVVGEAPHVEALVQRLDDAATRADTIWALGFSGRRIAAEALLPWLTDADCGTLAGEAFAAVTGLPVIEPYFVDAVAPDQETPELEDDDLDAELGEAPDDDLPVPEPDMIAQWWGEHRTRLSDGDRYVGGRLAHSTAYAEALATTSVRRRHALALEVALRTHGRHHIPTHTMATLQRPYLQAIPSLRELDGQRAFQRIG